MSHFSVLVLVEQEHANDVDNRVADLLAPYNESGEWFADGSRLDWHQIGGRFTGALDGYDPTKDPQNIEVCNICQGTGIRPGGLEEFGQKWFDACNGCNGCRGEGTSTKWPTQWERHPGDVLPVSEVAEGFAPTALVTPDGAWHEGARMGWFGAQIPNEQGQPGKSEDVWTTEVRALLKGHGDAIAVLVDAHV